MKQEISALMDGELFDDEAETLLDRIKRNPEARGDWQLYHLVGDALRQPDHIHPGIIGALRERLQAEPVILAPVARSRQNAKWFALSAAASVMALSLVAWMSAQVEQTAPQVAMQQAGAMRPASLPVKRGLNDYLMAHQEFSPSMNVQGAASYIRTVAGQ